MADSDAEVILRPSPLADQRTETHGRPIEPDDSVESIAILSHLETLLEVDNDTTGAIGATGAAIVITTVEFDRWHNFALHRGCNRLGTNLIESAVLTPATKLAMICEFDAQVHEHDDAVGNTSMIEQGKLPP